ncbi:hypothetical protein Tco_0363511 [Tanacetum coccineum]
MKEIWQRIQDGTLQGKGGEAFMKSRRCLIMFTNSSTNPTDDKERTLWVELKRLFEPDTDDILWKLQRYMHDPLTWRLYDTCGVHHVSIDRGHDIFMLVEKDYPLTRGLLTLMLCNKLQVDQYSEMADELLKKIVILANRPRQVWKSVRYGVSKGLDMAYWGFLRVGTTFDIFQNIHILYLQYGVLTSSGYGVLIFIPLWSLVSAGTDTPYLP